jgi:hypothetical protein
MMQKTKCLVGLHSFVFGEMVAQEYVFSLGTYTKYYTLESCVRCGQRRLVDGLGLWVGRKAE